MKTLLLVLASILILNQDLHSQIINTIAGNGSPAFTGDGGLAINAQLNRPNQIAIDQFGNMFIADDFNHAVRKITPTGTITTVAGNGTMGFSGDGGQATSAQLNRATGVAVDAAGNLYICDADNFRIRKVDPSGIITTIAGTGTNGHSGDGGPATSANIGFSSGIILDASGNIYIASQQQSYSVRKITPTGTITTVAGNGTSGHSGDGGLAVNAQFYSVCAIAFDNFGDLYVSDFTSRVRKVSMSTGSVTTVAGNGGFGSGGDGGQATNAQLFYPYGIAFDASNNMYVCEPGYNKIRKVNPSGVISTFAGAGGFSGGYSGDGGSPLSAQLNNASAITIDASGNFLIGDYANNAIRKITTGATGLTELANHEEQLTVYPNPNNGVFTLSFKEEGSYTIVNSIGQSVKHISAKKGECVEITDLSNGVYYITGLRSLGRIVVMK